MIYSSNGVDPGAKNFFMMGESEKVFVIMNF